MRPPPQHLVYVSHCAYPSKMQSVLRRNASTCPLREAEGFEALDGRATLDLRRIRHHILAPAGQQLHADHVAGRGRPERRLAL
jgi:hypothetical protein